MREPKEDGIESEDRRAQNLLSRCLVAGDINTDSRGGGTRTKAFGLSFVIEAGVLALLIVSPLLTSVAQPQLNKFLPSLAIHLVDWHERNTVKNLKATSQFSHPDNAVHTVDWRAQLSVPLKNESTNPQLDNTSVPDQLDESLTGTSRITDLVAIAPKMPTPPTVSQNARDTHLVRSEGLQEAQLISRVEPQYPYLARATRTEGIVVLHAVISRDGKITELEVVSGSGLLIPAALDAVRQWRYRPTLLGGTAVEVETTITVNFRLQ